MKRGSKHTTESKLKNSLSKKGKHYSVSTEIKQGQRLSKKTEFKKGVTPWNKGTKGVMKAWNKDKRCPQLQGENSGAWKGGLTKKNNLDRSRFRQTIQKKVFERDDYTCQMCDVKGGKLQVDHIQSWAEYIELRFEMNNLRTLCMECHYFITFGKKKPENVVWGHNFKHVEMRG